MFVPNFTLGLEVLQLLVSQKDRNYYAKAV